MLISKLVNEFNAPQQQQTEATDAQQLDRSGSLNHLWHQLKTEITSYEVDFTNSVFECSVCYDPSKPWVASTLTVDAEGNLKLAYQNSATFYTDVALKTCTAVGHLTAHMLEICSEQIEYVIKLEEADFSRACATAYAWCGLRPAGVNAKLWFASLKTAETSSHDLLRCEVRAFVPHSTMTNQHKNDPDANVKWAPALAKLKRNGVLQLVSVNDQVMYQINVKTLSSSRVVQVHHSLCRSETVLLLIPDMGGPQTVYIKFHHLDDFEDWFAALSSLTKQPVYTPLNHNPKKSLRAKQELLVGVSSCECTNATDLFGAYVDIAINGYVMARTSFNQTSELATWNQTFVLPSLDPLNTGDDPDNLSSNCRIELLLRRHTKDWDMDPLDFDDQVLGNMFLTPKEGSLSTEWENAGKNFSLLAGANFTQYYVMDPSYYRKLRHWTSHLDFNFATKLAAAYPPATTKLAKIFAKLYGCQGRLVVWLLKLVSEEIKNIDIESDTLFRGSSLMTSAIEGLFSMQGMPTLKHTIGKFLNHVLQGGVVTPELDPSRLKSANLGPEQIETNQKRMHAYLVMLWELIQAEGIPPSFAKVFQHMRAELKKRCTAFDEARIDKVMHRTLASFLFLRFYCPALLSPRNFGLTDVAIDPQQQRFMVLIAKILQGFANGVSFGAKENWLIPMNAFIIDHEEEISIWFKQIAIGVGECAQTADSTIANSATNPKTNTSQSSHAKEETQSLDKPVKELPFKPLMGQELTSPYLVDEYANYALLVTEIVEMSKSPKYNELAGSEKLLSDVAAECRSLESIKADLLLNLEKEDEFDDKVKTTSSLLTFNAETQLFGIKPQDLILPPELSKRKLTSTDRLAKFGLGYLANFESNGMRDRPRNNSVKKLTQFLKLSK